LHRRRDSGLSRILCIVGDDKGASLGVRGAGQAQQNDKTGQKSVH
jgi:hypothetical protein